jgi:fructokinase
MWIPRIPPKKIICYGELLWDLLPTGPQLGGAPVNVAYHLGKLGRQPVILTRIGRDDRGRELLDTLQKKGMCTDYVQVDELNPTGVVYVISNHSGEMQYDIVSPAAWDFISLQPGLISLVREADYFVFGSLVTRNRQSRDTLFTLLEQARNKVLDINLRPPHYNKLLVEELLHQADIVKMNIAELHLITAWYNGYGNDEDSIKSLSEKFAIKTIIVTKGDKGAVLYMNDVFFYHPGFAVAVVDTIGSGDSFLAAILSRLIDRSPPEKTLDFACALGAFVTSCRGACPDYEIEQVNALLNKNKDFFLNNNQAKKLN